MIEQHGTKLFDRELHKYFQYALAHFADGVKDKNEAEMNRAEELFIWVPQAAREYIIEVEMARRNPPKQDEKKVDEEVKKEEVAVDA